MLLTDLERLRNTLLAARRSVLLAGADGPWLAGYEAALVTVALAFGLEGCAVAQPPGEAEGLSSSEAKELNPQLRPTARLTGEGDRAEPAISDQTLTILGPIFDLYTVLLENNTKKS